MRCVFLVLLCLSFAGFAFSDNRPDAPTPKIESANAERLAVEHPASPSQHPFYDREARYTLALEAAAWAGDMAVTCRNLARNGREVDLPSQNCGAIVGMTLGFHAAAEGTAYLLHRLHWHQLERFPRWYLTGSSIYGLTFSVSHSNEGSR